LSEKRFAEYSVAAQAENLAGFGGSFGKLVIKNILATTGRFSKHEPADAIAAIENYFGGIRRLYNLDLK